MKEIKVALGRRSYSIHIGAGALGQVGEFIQKLGDFSHYLIVTDDNVETLYYDRLVSGPFWKDKAVDLFVIPAGEESKSVGALSALWEGFLQAGADRSSLVLALGGGVVGDLAGFAAASYMRGIPFFQIPTTLLAQTDSSVGGKTGIDLEAGKNIVGAFHQPIGVLIDPETLLTLPEWEYRAGLGEVVKYAVSLDADFLNFLETHCGEINARDQKTLAEIISRSCRIKAKIVRDDEKETKGVRALLNYGHTFAHAYETAAEYSGILHGEAVALGMLDAVRLAQRLAKNGRSEFQGADASLVRRYQSLWKELSLPSSLADLPVKTEKSKETDAWRAKNLLAIMKRDKKSQKGQLRLVLPTAPGASAVFADIPERTVLSLLKKREEEFYA